MKVVMTAIGTTGDVFPFIGLGLGFKRRGHDVTLITHSHFAVPVLRAGLGFAPVGTEQEYLAALSANPRIWDRREGYPEVVRCATALVPEMLETITENIVPQRTMVVAHYLDFAARLVQATYGNPTVTVLVSPMAFEFAAGYLSSAELPPALAGIRGAVGQGWSFSPLLTIGLFPPWFGTPEPHWPANVQLSGFPMFDGVEDVPPEVSAFLEDGPPPIAFTVAPNLQMSLTANAQRFLDAAVGACTRLGRRGLILGGVRCGTVDLPAGMLHSRFAPLTQVLPRCAALVHHGGVGTTAAAFLAGIPQLAAPVCHDQPDNARRIKDLGVGDWVPAADADGPLVAERIGALLESPVVGERCQEIAARLARADGVGAACALVEFVAPLGASTPSMLDAPVLGVPEMIGPLNGGCGCARDCGPGWVG